MLIASEQRGGDYAFLSLKTAAFDLSDRGVAGRTVPAGLDAFVYTERGVYRSGETVYVTAILRDSNGVASAGAPLTLVVERPDGLEYRRVTVADQGVGGRSLSVPIAATASTGTWRVRAFTDPKRPPVGETSFMVEDYVPDRLEFDLASPTGRISQTVPADVTLDGRYLYGAPASGLDLEGEIIYGAAKERPGFAGYLFGLADEEVTDHPAAAHGLARDRRERQGPFQGQCNQSADFDPAAGGASCGAHGRSRRPRHRAQDRPAGGSKRQHGRRQAAVLRPLARRRRRRDI